VFNHILAAVDGSSHAQRAVETAAWLAKKVDAKLLSLCHVVGSGPVPAELTHMAEVEHLVPGPRPAGVQIVENVMGNLATIERVGEAGEISYETRLAISRKILHDASGTAVRLGAPSVEAVLLEGQAVPEILDLANKIHADLIVMGSRGLSDLKGLLMGSVSHRICQLAGCPCLTVR